VPQPLRHRRLPPDADRPDADAGAHHRGRGCVMSPNKIRARPVIAEPAGFTGRTHCESATSPPWTSVCPALSRAAAGGPAGRALHARAVADEGEIAALAAGIALVALEASLANTLETVIQRLGECGVDRHGPDGAVAGDGLRSGDRPPARPCGPHYRAPP